MALIVKLQMALSELLQTLLRALISKIQPYEIFISTEKFFSLFSAMKISTIFFGHFRKMAFKHN